MCLTYTALFALFTLARAGDPTTVDFVRDNFLTLEEQLWKNVTDPVWTDTGSGGDVELTKVFVAFDEQLESVPRPPNPPFSSWLWERALEKLRLIDGFYKNFVGFVRRQSVPGAVPAPVKDWLDIAEHVLMDPKSSVAQAVRKIYDLLEHGDMFRAALQDSRDVCELQLSQHQLIYDMYNTISLSEIKGYAMMQFSWMLLRIYGKGNFTQEASLTRIRYMERTAKTATIARDALTMARRDLYRCDAAIHKEGETFAQVTRLLQGYIENEVDMNPEGTCKNNCAYYSVSKNYGCFKDGSKYCGKQQRCEGRMFDCQYIDSDMWVCPAKRNSHRRYEWIEYENGRRLGQGAACTNGVTKVDSWWTPPLYHCSYCMCLCEDRAEEADRVFSLAEAVSDANKSRVVTGIRLIKLGRVFHLQIAEGTLGKRGEVAPGNWVPVQKFDPTDFHVKDGVDFHTLTYEKRAIDLDELDSPSGSILTGIRFRMLGSHLHFEIRSTPFNFTTGRLSPQKSEWISNDNTDGSDRPRRRLVLSKPDIPTRSHVSLPLDSEHDQYLEFTHSDLDADAAQSTVPFVDIQEVMPLKGAALVSGAGIIHRGAPGSGGYIGVKMITYDYTRHVIASPPPAPPSPDDDGETTEFSPVIN